MNNINKHDIIKYTLNRKPGVYGFVFNIIIGNYLPLYYIQYAWYDYPVRIPTSIDDCDFEYQDVNDDVFITDIFRD